MFAPGVESVIVTWIGELVVSDPGEMTGVAAVGGPEPSRPYTSTAVEVPT